MKKLICVLLLVTMICTLFAACKKETFKCESCGEEKEGKGATEIIDGEEITYCEDCEEDIKALKDLENSLAELDEALGDLEDLEKELDALEGLY